MSINKCEGTITKFRTRHKFFSNKLATYRERFTVTACKVDKRTSIQLLGVFGLSLCLRHFLSLLPFFSFSRLLYFSLHFHAFSSLLRFLRLTFFYILAHLHGYRNLLWLRIQAEYKLTYFQKIYDTAFI